MKGMFVILLFTIAVGIVLYLVDVFYYRKKKDSGADDTSVETFSYSENNGNGEPGDEDSRKTEDSAGEGVPDGSSGEAHGEVCCGLHLVCEKNSLSPVTDEIIYYDDEELDRYAGRSSDSYSPEEEEEFREILLTLLPSDAAGWSRSLQLRGVSLPDEIREELLMIVAEERARQNP